jgi:hypothetical protein
MKTKVWLGPPERGKICLPLLLEACTYFRYGHTVEYVLLKARAFEIVHNYGASLRKVMQIHTLPPISLCVILIHVTRFDCP